MKDWEEKDHLAIIQFRDEDQTKVLTVEMV